MTYASAPALLRAASRRAFRLRRVAAGLLGLLLLIEPLAGQARPQGRPPSAPAQTATPAPAPADSAPGGQLCGQREEVVSRLQEKYGETRRGYGLQRGAAVVEVYASDRTGSWTIILSTPNGLACLVAAGQNWAATPEEASLRLGDPA